MIPTFSVAMPTRGRHILVERAIRSVLRQSFHDFELIVLDNSPPVERDEIKKIVQLDSRIVLIERGETGVTQARKLGATLARGKLFALLDSDDYWSQERLETHVDIWNRYPIGLSWDRWAQDDGARPKPFPVPFAPGLIDPPKVAVRLYHWNFIHASAGIVLTEFAKSRGFPIPGITSSDWPLFMRAAESRPAYFVGQVLSFNDTSSPNRVTSNMSRKMFDDETRMIRRWFVRNKPWIYGRPFLQRTVARRIGLVAN